MRGKKKIIVYSIIAVIVGSLLIVVVNKNIELTQKQNKILFLTARTDTLNENISDLKNDSIYLQTKITNLNQDLEDVEKELGESESLNNSLFEQIDSFNEKLRIVGIKLRKKNRELDRIRSELKEERSRRKIAEDNLMKFTRSNRELRKELNISNSKSTNSELELIRLRKARAPRVNIFIHLNHPIVQQSYSAIKEYIKNPTPEQFNHVYSEKMKHFRRICRRKIHIAPEFVYQFLKSMGYHDVENVTERQIKQLMKQIIDTDLEYLLINLYDIPNAIAEQSVIIIRNAYCK